MYTVSKGSAYQLIVVIILLILSSLYLKDELEGYRSIEENLIKECEKDLKRTEKCIIQIRAVKES